jgi:hypothetical protein
MALSITSLPEKIMRIQNEVSLSSFVYVGALIDALGFPFTGGVLTTSNACSLII